MAPTHEMPHEEAAHEWSGLTRLLDVEPLDVDLYRGPNRPGARARIFGGMVVAQALMAAQRSAPDGMSAHSLHANFLRGGREAAPIILRVLRDFDGGSFANRRVVASQAGATLLTLTASFQRDEAGLSHQDEMPEVPGPDGLLDLAGHAERLAGTLPPSARAMLLHPSAFEIRPVGSPSFLNRGIAAPAAAMWFRARAVEPVDAAIARAVLAYVSDYSLLSSAVIAHDVNLFDHAMQTASLDHAVWFHGDVPLADWLLYATESPWSGHGRGFARGAVWTRGGRRVASTAQEGLIRMRPDREAGLTVPHVP